ncbi:MAG: O-antigen ligase family protein [Pyrinomonadaceae bacterium]
MKAWWLKLSEPSFILHPSSFALMSDVTAETVTERAAGGRESAGVAAVWLERLVVGCLFAFAFCAPHSIAAAEGVWVLGMLAWAARFAFRPRPVLHRTPVDYALLGFFVLTFVTAFFSYEPDESFGKLRAASLFTIAYLAAQNTPSRRMLRALVITLVASCMLNVAYTFVVLARGHGVAINALSAESPLAAVGVRAGDTLLEVDRAPVKNPADVERGLNARRTTRETTVRWPDGKSACVADERLACLKGVRTEVPLAINIERGKFLEGATPEARLGITGWSRGRDERATGFYGHYTTYAEVLQLIGSLALGLLVALLAARRRREAAGARVLNSRWPVALLALAVGGIGVALLLTVTRASWAAFLVSILLIVLVGAASRRVLVVAVLAVVVCVPVGLYVLRAQRGVGFIDQRDESTTWRETVWREGFDKLISQPRHLIVGVGMDSLKHRWREWGMFDHGRLPWGHLHSTPLQIAFERGLPTLVAWLALLFLYWRMLWRLARRCVAGGDWIERGLALGALGGAVGFFTSGLVHYNLGDSEVAMTFYFIMGLALALERLTAGEAAKEFAA